VDTSVYNMKKEIIRGQTPEERELEKKISELSELEEELTKRELDFATVRLELRNFEAKYIQIVGIRLAKLDEIYAQIAENKVRLRPEDEIIQHKASKARSQAKESAQAIGTTHDTVVKKYAHSETLKKLYREIAKRIHPDLTIDEKERRLREQLMAEVNLAYNEGDESRLYAILEKWENSPESIKGDGIPSELVRVIRKIDQVNKRLHLITTEITQLEKSDINQLRIIVLKAECEGKDLLAEMASRVDKDIALAKKHLAEISVKEKIRR
jgi:hypothetical protein